MILYTLFFNDLFNTQPLTVAELGITVVVSSLVFWVVELQNLIGRRCEKLFVPACGRGRNGLDVASLSRRYLGAAFVPASADEVRAKYCLHLPKRASHHFFGRGLQGWFGYGGCRHRPRGLQGE